MGGGGSGYSYSNRDTEEIRRALRERLSDDRAEAEINAELNARLAEVNRRDTEAISERLDAIEEALGDEADIEKLLYGGSVAKHTFVDGLSDIDSLVVVNREALGSGDPESLREGFAQLLRERLPAGEVADVVVGNMAVTVTYRDGTQIQLLPAVTHEGKLSISSQTGKHWRAIDPKKFAEQLTAVNRSQGERVVPTIKLAKSVIAGLPQRAKLSGYHVEALAVAAFKGYQGGTSLKEMLTHFFATAANNILKPVPDITGQSRQVDARWGPENSSQRRAAAVDLKRVAQRMQSETSPEEWRKLVDPGS
jgi:hypothetical protein